MKRGKNEAETLALNGWTVGDILEGDEGNGPERIRIVAIGQENFIAQWGYKATGTYDRESPNTTLSCREWRKVGHSPLTPKAATAPTAASASTADAAETVKVRYFVRTDNIGSTCEDTIEFDRAEWEAMTPEQQEAEMKDIVFQHVDWSFYLVEDNQNEQ